METKHAQQFVLEKVVTFPYYYNYLLGLVIVVPVCFLYGLFGLRYFGLWGLIFAFFIGGFMVTWIIRSLSKSITISFDDDNMYLAYINGETEKYAKTEISGFYSYDYERIEKSFISIQFILKNGKKIELTDINISERIDKEKALTLRKFLKAARRELNFTLINKNRARSLQKLGAEWYATTPGS